MTAQHEAEAALAESDRSLRPVFDQLPIGVTLAGLDFRFQRVNARFSRMTGYSMEELLKRGFSDITHPDDIASDSAQVERLVAGDIDEYARRRRYVRKDGSVAWGDVIVRPVLDETGKALAFVILVNDVTAQKRVEGELHRELDRVRSYLDIASVMLVAIASDETVLFANRRACAVLDRDVTAIVGSNWFDTALPAAEREPTRAVFARLMAGDLESLECVETPVLSSGGVERLVAWHNTTMRDEAGTIVATLSSGEDITDRKQTERLLSVPSEVLEILTTPIPVPLIIEGIVAALRRATRLDAVGLRLRRGDDYPSAVAMGYTDDLVQEESISAVHFPDGGLCRDEEGRVSLECTCGLVLSGSTDPTNPLFTPGGSAWTNHAPPLPDAPPDQARKLHPRSRCMHVGFQSIALVPLRAGEEIIGLLHFGDRRRNCFTAESIRFLEGVGTSIGVALLRRRAEEQIELRSEELARANTELAARASALEEANATISRIAATDHLTALANRRHFSDSLEKAVSLARRHGSPLALMSLDLDGLKRVNDSAGHPAGDAVLAGFATLLGSLCRAEDLAARLGGDEFGLVLPGIDLDGARALAERVLEAARSCEALTRHGVTASAGVAACSTNDLPDDLLRRADKALYAAKRSGGDAVACDG